MDFVWDPRKEKRNIEKHGVDFTEAGQAFLDPSRIIMEDILHSTESEKRYFCLGKIAGRVLTVRFTVRGGNIRIFGAGYWRAGRKRYEMEYKGGA